MLEHWEAHDTGRATQNLRHKLNLRPRWVPKSQCSDYTEPSTPFLLCYQPTSKFPLEYPQTPSKSMFVFASIYSKNIFLIHGATVAPDAQRLTAQAAELQFTARTAGVVHEQGYPALWTTKWSRDGQSPELSGEPTDFFCFYKLYKPSLKTKKIQAEPEV